MKFQEELVAQFERHGGATEVNGHNVIVAILGVGDHGRRVELLASVLHFHGSGESLASLRVGEDGVGSL